MTKQYWIISFSETDAHIVKANNPDNVEDHEQTFKVDYRELRYKYIDIEKEAREEARSKKHQIDPRILLDESKTIEDILKLDYFIERQTEKEYLTKILTLIRKAPENIKRDKIKEYIRLQEMSEENIYAEEIIKLGIKKDYNPKKIKNFTELEFKFALPQAGYSYRRDGFENIDQLLLELYNNWEHKNNLN